MPIATIVYWYGPFSSVDTLREYAEADWGRGERALYMALGKGNVINYIGRSQSINTRFRGHNKIHAPENVKFFIGEIATQGISGKRQKKAAPDLDLAERTLISYFKPKMNDRLLNAAIDDDVSITSYFFRHHEDVELLNPRPLKKFPIHISYSCWREGFVKESD